MGVVAVFPAIWDLDDDHHAQSPTDRLLRGDLCGAAGPVCAHAPLPPPASRAAHRTGGLLPLRMHANGVYHHHQHFPFSQAARPFLFAVLYHCGHAVFLPLSADFAADDGDFGHLSAIGGAVPPAGGGHF